MCGENEEILYDRRYVGGSPPRVRGKLVLARVLSRIGRITPACAGKTEFYGIALAWYEDHPRVCGENSLPRHEVINGTGSPPRVRGKPISRGVTGEPKRITPACAGKTFHIEIFCLFLTDHPRVCGENMRGHITDNPRKGSPPRVRGKLFFPARASARARITPACAGKTF